MTQIWELWGTLSVLGNVELGYTNERILNYNIMLECVLNINMPFKGTISLHKLIQM